METKFLDRLSSLILSIVDPQVLDLCVSVAVCAIIFIFRYRLLNFSAAMPLLATFRPQSPYSSPYSFMKQFGRKGKKKLTIIFHHIIYQYYRFSIHLHVI